jgi:hypothetical protein
VGSVDAHNVYGVTGTRHTFDKASTSYAEVTYLQSNAFSVSINCAPTDRNAEPINMEAPWNAGVDAG